MSYRIHNQHLPKQKNSWYLRTGEIHHFLCKCGRVEQFANLVLAMHHPNYRCSSCGNTHYLDSVMFLNNEKVTRWSLFHWELENVKTETFWKIQAYAFVPIFDFALQKIRVKKVIIASNVLSFNGKITYHEENAVIMKKYVYNNAESPTLVKELIDADIDESLYQFILKEPREDIEWIEKEEISKYDAKEKLKLFSFFLKHPHLREYDFFKWKDFVMFSKISQEYSTVAKLLDYIFLHRKEKSIKKAYFQSYIKSMQIHGSYNYEADYIFARHINDRNFLLRLIHMNIKIKHTLFNEAHIVTIDELIIFLKEYYNERAITKLFTDIEQYLEVLRDTIWLFRGINALHIREYFRKVPLNFENLHIEFIRIQNILGKHHMQNQFFEYHENDLKAEGKRGIFEYQLPESNYILDDWGMELHNCVSGYSSVIHKGKSVIFAVFKEGKIHYAIEIQANKIVQALGKYNKDIEDEDKLEIDAWFKDVYIQSWLGSIVGRGSGVYS